MRHCFFPQLGTQHMGTLPAFTRGLCLCAVFVPTGGVWDGSIGRAIGGEACH